MKISFVSVSENGFHVDQLKVEAALRKIDFEVINFTDYSDFESKYDSLGEVVLWRSSDMDIGVSRTLAMQLIAKKSYLINLGVGLHPFVTNKIYQQKTIGEYLDYAAIPTFTFADRASLNSAIEKGELRYPFIQKPNLGARGVDVRLIRSASDLEENLKPVKTYVYQNYIKNNGDYRVFVLGGKLLGVMKRVAKEGSILNNVSQGASAYVETDSKILKEVRDIALRVASLFNLQMCGVDIIFDSENGKYYFLEVNTVPQWKGFSESTGINVAAEIIDYCIQMGSRKTLQSSDLIREYYDKNYKYLGAQKFHLASRMYLWTRDEKYRAYLDEFRQPESLYDLENGEIEKRIQSSLFEDPIYKTEKVSAKKLYRRELRNKYPMMKKYSEVFAIYFWAKNLYNLDIASLVEKYIQDEKALELFNQVLNDHEAIAHASTSCINFLYFTKFYLNHKGHNLSIDPLVFLQITHENLKQKVEDMDKKVYLLTHVLIGESQMYLQNLSSSEIYLQIIKELEKDLHENFSYATLDMKLEFLVCCKLCGYSSILEKIIIKQAETSLAIVGNFIVDKGFLENRLSENLNASEHRNTLYLMAISKRII